jgi:SM-20-related protein
MKEKLYSKIIDGLVEDGYVVIDDALDSTLCDELLLVAKDDRDYKKAGISKNTKYHIDNTRRSDKIRWLDKDGTTAESRFLDFAKELQEYINKTLYMGLSYYESHFAVYKEGDFYEKHLDSFKNSKNRVVTTVYYLNNNWDENNGGELVIYDENGAKIELLTPISNRLVVFLSEKFPHEVLKANKQRHSIAGWFRVDKRGA